MSELRPPQSQSQSRIGLGRTLSTFPVSLTGCDAPIKVLMRAELTRGDTDSVDISKLSSCMWAVCGARADTV